MVLSAFSTGGESIQLYLHAAFSKTQSLSYSDKVTMGSNLRYRDESYQKVLRKYMIICKIELDRNQMLI